MEPLPCGDKPPGGVTSQGLDQQQAAIVVETPGPECVYLKLKVSAGVRESNKDIKRVTHAQPVVHGQLSGGRQARKGIIRRLRCGRRD
jgi:hypothetical protein